MDQRRVSIFSAYPNVRFGSKADICNANTHVRFTPESDRGSDFPQGSFARAGYPLLDRPMPTGALSLDLRCCILTNFIAQPCDEVFNDLAFGSARCNEDEIRSPAHCPFAAKRRDQQALSEV